MSPVLYQKNGVLIDGEYLPGHYWWTSDVVITGILVQGTMPTAGTFHLQLEINGVLTDYALPVQAGTGAFKLTDSLVAAVPADQNVRWKASFSGTPAQAPMAVALTMSVAPAGAVVNPVLTVRDGATGIVYYSYNAQTGVFAKVVPLGVTPAWALIQDGETELLIQYNGSEIFSVENGAVNAETFSASNPVSPKGTAAAIFYVGNTPVGTLTKTGGFYAANITEDSPAQLSELSAAYYSQFEFWSNGQLTAALGATGLTAASIVESNTP